MCVCVPLLAHITCFRIVRILTDDAVLLVQQRRAVRDAGLLSSGSGRAGPARVPGGGHEGGAAAGAGVGELRGHQRGPVLCARGLRGRAVTFCQPGVGIGRLRRAVHPGGCDGVLVVTPGDLTHRSRGFWVLLQVA